VHKRFQIHQKHICTLKNTYARSEYFIRHEIQSHSCDPLNRATIINAYAHLHICFLYDHMHIKTNAPTTKYDFAYKTHFMSQTHILRNYFPLEDRWINQLITNLLIC
jgi:hypothetical protein